MMNYQVAATSSDRSSVFVSDLDVSQMAIAVLRIEGSAAEAVLGALSQIDFPPL